MRAILLHFLLSFIFTVAAYCQSESEIFLPESPQPYPLLKAVESGKSTMYSPDPLINFRWKSPKASDGLEVYALAPVSVSCEHANAAVWNAKTIAPIEITGECTLQFDFGRVSAGWLEFESEDFEGEVEMSISEYNQPAVTNWMVKHSKKTNAPVKYGNTYRLELNDQLYEGVRFGWIHIRKLSHPFKINNVRLVCQAKPANYDGSFNCSDPTLNSIWYTGAYTVRLNFLKDYFGAILMDRGDRYSWTGDAHISQYVSLLAFGNYDFVKNNLIRTADDANGIASYSLYWVQSLIDYYYFTNDKALFEKYIPNVCGKLDTAYLLWGKNPNLGFYGWDERLGAGFETPNCEENQQAYKMLSVGTWRAFGEALKSFGKPELAPKYKGFADEKTQEIRNDSQWFSPLGIHASADAVNALIPDKAEQQKIWENAFSDRLQRISYSPFNQYFIIRAMANMNRYSQALTTIDDCWGGQIRNGATTTYEVYHPSWNTAQSSCSPPVNMQFGFTSLAHPWSAGPSRWLSEEILGIKPMSPGFSTFSFMPHLSAGVTFVEGKVPSPHGFISASFNIINGKGSIEVPPGTTARIGIPKSGMSILYVKFNNKSISKSAEDGDFLYFENLSEGRYSISVKYKGWPFADQTEMLEYSCSKQVSEDSVTSGNWVGTYGTKGYLICDFGGKNLHRTKMPDFAESVEVKCAENFRDWGSGIVSVNASDGRALISDKMGEEKRSVGILNAITTTIEINCKDQSEYKLSLYFTDWKHENLSSVIEVFDLNTKKILMPDYFISNYQNGKYINLQLNQSVRIRIQRVSGENTSLGGVFFD
jgi:hypothetical protein